MNYLKHLDGLLTLLLFGLVALGVWFWRVHKNPAIDFDFFDLILENGRISRIASVFIGSFAMTTWMMVRLTVDGKMTEGYFTTYSAAWIVPIVAKLFSPQASAGTTTVSTTSIKTVEAPVEELKS